MKPCILFFLVACCFSIPFSSCKKGPDDPFISFRSRKARLAGKWTLTNGTDNATSIYNGTNSIDDLSVNGTTFTEVTDNGATSGSITMEVDFTKDGQFNLSITQIYTSGATNLTTQSGTWDFLGGIGSLKNKEAIVLVPLSEVTTTTSSTTLFSYATDCTGTTWTLTGLHDKSLIVDFQYSETSPYINSEVVHYEFSKE